MFKSSSLSVTASALTLLLVEEYHLRARTGSPKRSTQTDLLPSCSTTQIVRDCSQALIPTKSIWLNADFERRFLIPRGNGGRRPMNVKDCWPSHPSTLNSRHDRRPSVRRLLGHIARSTHRERTRQRNARRTDNGGRDWELEQELGDRHI